jgi:glycine betaine/choline ABC-type transport system substrate-binding protein/ABC-type proline/glycine betaine transport system permease subunit
MSWMNEFFSFISSRSGQINQLILQHIGLTLLAVLLSIALGVPLGILITRVRKLSRPIVGTANVVQAIPSLALLGFLIPILGIGSKPAIIMVFLYSLLPILKNTYTGLTNINPDLIEAAQGMGMTQAQILRKVQIPLALPIIMAGIRISAVTAVGLMTIAAFVGAGGLGYMVFSGVQMVNNNMVLAGAIPACILALLMDFIIGKIELGVTPKGIKTADGKMKTKATSFKIPKKYFVPVTTILVLALIATSVRAYINKKDSIVVGSKNFNEQLIIGNMMADLLEEYTDLNVVRKLNLGGTSVAYNALETGELDVYAEYTGTALVNIMQHETVTDSEKAYNIVKEYFNKEHQLSFLEPIGFNNTYTLSISKELAGKYNMKTFSDLAKVSNGLVLGSTMEFANRQDGYLGLKEVYNMNFKEVKGMDGGLRYTSLNSKETDVTDAFSTDGLLKAFDLVVLEDDMNFFPPYYAVPFVRNETLEKYPEVKDVLNKLAGLIDDEEMRELNYKVDKLGESPEKVSKDFLKMKRLIK